VDFILKKAMKGKLDLMGPAQKVAGELMSIPDMSAPEGEYGVEGKYIANFKKAILMTAGAAVQKLMMSLAKEQEVLMGIADMMIEVYVAESMLLRVKKIDGDKSLEETIMRAYIYDAADRINKSGKDVLNSFAEGDELRMMLIGLKRFTKHDHLNIKEAKRMIADSKIKA
jgi:hypothetical protein